MFYVIETNYAGPNPLDSRYIDANTIVISTSPATTNSSKVVRLEGWCGTTNDWAVYAHGEYSSVEQARDAITAIFNNVRSGDANGAFASDDEAIIAVYKPGRFAPMTKEHTGDWAHDGIEADIDASTTDARITELVAEYEAEANSEGFTLDSDLADMMKAHRQALQDDAGAD